MRAEVVILYEDEFGQVKDFALHRLVTACVADTLGRSKQDVAPLLRAVPKKGDSKLLDACLREAPRMREANVFALFDSDNLHRLLGLSGDTQLADQLAALRSRLPDEGRPRVFLLERNTETLVAAAADCLGREPPSGKSKLDRDKLLASAAWDYSRASRDCIRERVASFDAFIAELTPLVQSAIPA